MPLTTCAKADKSNGQALHRFLLEHEMLDPRFKPKLSGDAILFAIVPDQCAMGLPAYAKVVKAAMEKKPAPRKSLHQLLMGALTEAQMAHLLNSFDVYGSIAVIDLPEALAPHARLIADAMLQAYPHLKTVAQKSSATGGKYRIRKVRVLAGEKTTRTVAVESGCRFEVDINKAYYTPRFSHERLRIAALVQPGEKILVPFAGIGPYPIVLERHADPARITAIELNPAAVSLMERNVALNHCAKIHALKGDAKVLMSKLPADYDRILMPHPSASLDFLSAALRCAKDGAMLHLYAFDKTGVKGKNVWALARKIAKSAGFSLTLNGVRVARPFSAAQEQVVLDLCVRRKLIRVRH